MGQLSLEEEPEVESYLFGLASPSIRRKTRGWYSPTSCSGLYATNRRIFLLKAPLRMQLRFYLPLGVGGALEFSGLCISIFMFLTGNFHLVDNVSTILLLPGIVLILLANQANYSRDFSVIPIQELEDGREEGLRG